MALLTIRSAVMYQNISKKRVPDRTRLSIFCWCLGIGGRHHQVLRVEPVIDSLQDDARVVAILRAPALTDVDLQSAVVVAQLIVGERGNVRELEDGHNVAVREADGDVLLRRRTNWLRQLSIQSRGERAHDISVSRKETSARTSCRRSRSSSRSKSRSTLGPRHRALDLDALTDPVSILRADGATLLVLVPVEDEPVVEDTARQRTVCCGRDGIPEGLHLQRLVAVHEGHKLLILLELTLTPLPDPLLNAAVQGEGLRRPEHGALREGRDQRHVGGHFAVFETNSLVVPKVP